MKYVIAAVLAAGCASRAKGAEALLDSVRTYHEGLRWDRIPVAASRIPPDERAEFIAERDDLADDLRINDYEVIEVAEADRAAVVQVKYVWYLDSRQVVHETRVSEDWERKGDLWIRVDEHRIKGEKMPGVPEPVDGADDAPDDEAGGSEVSRDDSVEGPGD